ncbi:MAG: sel1 repeat family protein, partial [Desulfovibrionaceae bacterium]|nr:sel1 repeat family protein [Desulfovibrionaceae bacterium]
YYMARLYENGVGVKPSVPEKLRWYREAAKNNHPQALACIGFYYWTGKDKVKRDERLGLEYIKQAAELGEPSALANLGFLYYFMEDKPKEGLKYLEQAADLGNSRAQVNLGCLYLKGDKHVKQNFSKGWENVRKAFEDSVPEASLIYTIAYGSGIYGLEKNLKKAFSYIDDDYVLDNNLNLLVYNSMFYHTGYVVRKDNEFAIWLLEKYKSEGNTSLLSNEKYDILDLIYNTEGDAVDVEDKLNVYENKLRIFDSKEVNYALKELKEFANSGNIRACNILGNYYYENREDPKNFQEAKSWYKKAVDANDAEGICNYGLCLLFDDKFDRARACKYFLKSAEQQYARAYYELARMCILDGEYDLSFDYAQAVKYVKTALELSEKEDLFEYWLGNAYFILGLAYFEGRGVEKNLKKAFEMFSEGREYSNLSSSLYLSKMYDQGLYVKEDKYHAFKLMEFISNRSDLYINREANYYLEGKAIPRNIDAALGLYYLADEKGYSVASFNIAKIYFAGFYSYYDPKDGLKYLTKGSLAANHHAIFLQALLHECGYLFQKNDKIAIAYYKLALLYNNVKSMVNLGVKYLLGEGCEVNKKEALALFSKAAEANNAVAKTNLGLMYEFGLGVDQDLKLARRWFQSAADQGDSFALDWIDGKVADTSKPNFRKIFVQDYLNIQELAEGTYEAPGKDDPIDLEPLEDLLEEGHVEVGRVIGRAMELRSSDPVENSFVNINQRDAYVDQRSKLMTDIVAICQQEFKGLTPKKTLKTFKPNDMEVKLKERSPITRDFEHKTEMQVLGDKVLGVEDPVENILSKANKKRKKHKKRKK